jgi:sulfane dehydrogenase subunit SoxC
MKPQDSADVAEQVAANGLLHRRLFLNGGVALLGAGVTLMRAVPAAAGTGEIPPWTSTPGAGMSPYGARSPHETHVQRSVGAAPGAPGTGTSRTPLESLEGIITPNGLHFERHHNGVPDIDPDRHRLLIHGLVRKPLTFSTRVPSP